MIIEYFSDLSTEEAETVKAPYIYISNPNESPKTKVYTKQQFIETKKAIKDFFKDMPNIPTDIPNREMLLFSYVYTKLSSMITYDYFALQASNSTGYYREQAEDLLNRTATAYGGLVCGKAFCSGFSNTLKLLLEEIGIKCKEISGGPEHRTNGNAGSHVWNQVYLDGKWYNCDLTNDYDFILEGLTAPFFLKSNDDFDRYDKYPPKLPEEIEDATTSISPQQQEQLIADAKLIIEQEKINKSEREQREEIEESKRIKQEKFEKLPKFIQKVIILFSSKSKEGVEK